MSDADFADLIEPVALELWGDPGERGARKLKWGNNGSRTVNLEEKVWYDHEQKLGGGTLQLVMHELGCDKATALDWLASHGHIAPRDGNSTPEPAKAHVEHHAEQQDGVLVEVATYDYADGDGEPLYQVVRYQKKLPDGSWQLNKEGAARKTFRQRRRVNGQWVWNLDRIGHSLYRLQQLELAVEAGATVYLAEGEKDVHTLEGWGLCGTTNSGGAQGWRPEMAQHFRGADVVILIDNDDAGRTRGDVVAASLKGVAGRIRVLDLAEHVPSFPAKGDITDWVAMGGLKERFEQIVSRLPDWSPKPPPSKFGARMVSRQGDSGIAYEWLVKGVIERGGVFFIVGEMQSGKSFFAMDMGMKVATGVNYGDRKVRQGLVIYCACEDFKGVNMRASGYLLDKGVETAVPMVILQKVNLMDDDSVTQFIAECRAWEMYFGQKLELVFIDTLSVAAEGMDEISSVDTSRVLGRINRIAVELQAAVGVVHHFNADGKRARGHSSLTANVSQVIELRPVPKETMKKGGEPDFVKDDDGRIIRKAFLLKNKNGPNHIKWSFVLRLVITGKDDDGADTTTCVLDTPSGKGYERTGSGKGRLSPDHRMVLDALQAAIETAGADRPAGIRAPDAVRRVAPETALVAQLRKVWPFKSAETEIEARKTELGEVLSRATKALINGGYMGRDNDLHIVWPTGREDREPAPRTPPSETKPQLPPDVLAEIRESGVPF